MEDSFGSLRFNILVAITKLRIPDILVNRRLSLSEISAFTGVEDKSKLLRLLIAAKGIGYFKQDEQGQWYNSALSAVLSASHKTPYRSSVKIYADDHYETWGHIYESLRLPSTNDEDLFFPKLHGGKSVWEFFRDHPDRQKQFGDAMAELDAFIHYGVVHDYDWSEYNRVLDLGGNEGSMLYAILAGHPNLTGVLMDLPSVIEKNAKPVWATRFADLISRVDFVAGDLFVASTIPKGQDGDAYLMRNILHDWSDKESIAILKVIRSAMGTAKATLTLAEIAPKEKNEDWRRLMTDINMMLMYNGMERTASQWSALFEASGFKFVRVVELRAGLRLVEGKPV